MISETYPKKYCSEPLENIENYQEAISDSETNWVCHHRAEILPCGKFSRESLKAVGLYFNRPASELIFLKEDEHRRLHALGNTHARGVKLGEEAKKHMSERFTNREDQSIEVEMTRLADDSRMVFPSMGEAARWLRENGYPRATTAGISLCANGHQTKAYNAKWRII